MLNLPSVLYRIDIFRFVQSLILINASFLKLQFLFAFVLSFLFLGYSLRENREIYAIYSTGISKTQFLKFITVINIFAVIIATIISFFLVPKANRERVKFITVNVKKYFLESIQPKNFTTLPGNYTIYISNKEKDKLENVLIYNQSNGFLITAKEAFFKDTNLILNEGIVQIPAENGFNALTYKKYVFDLKIKYEKEYSIEDFSIKDLINIVSSNSIDKLKALAVLSERAGYVIPFFFISIIFFFLGLNLNKERDFILAVSLGFLVVYISANYYVLKLVENGNLSPVVYLLAFLLFFWSLTVFIYKKV
jgi:lipopolysaccharide export system permease protein